MYLFIQVYIGIYNCSYTYIYKYTWACEPSPAAARTQRCVLKVTCSYMQVEADFF